MENPLKPSTNLTFLDVVYEPPEDQVKVDIVFVHGLNPLDKTGHAYRTWTHKDGCLWPKDLLPKDIPFARVLLFGYNSSVLRNKDNVNTRQYANVLLDRLDGERSKDTAASQRPLIFIAHSLGGLVVKQALINAKVDDSFRPILEHTYGLVFFGTPHKGSPKADIGNKIQMILKPISAGSQLLEALGTNSQQIQEHMDYFRHLMDRFEVVTFFETKYSRLGGMTVPHSSSLMSAGKETQLPIEGDHSSICKFSSEKDQTYKPVITHLKRLANAAVAKAEGRGPFVRSKTLKDPEPEPMVDKKEALKRSETDPIISSPQEPSTISMPSAPYILVPRTPPPPPPYEQEDEVEEESYVHNPARDSGFAESKLFQRAPSVRQNLNRQSMFINTGRPNLPFDEKAAAVQMPSGPSDNDKDAQNAIFNALHGNNMQPQRSIPMPGAGGNGYDAMFYENHDVHMSDYYPQQHIQQQHIQMPPQPYPGTRGEQHMMYYEPQYITQPGPQYHNQYEVNPIAMGGFAVDVAYNREQALPRMAVRQSGHPGEALHHEDPRVLYGADFFAYANS